MEVLEVSTVESLVSQTGPNEVIAQVFGPKRRD